MAHLGTGWISCNGVPVLAKLLALVEQILPAKELRQNEAHEGERGEESCISQAQLVAIDIGALHQLVQHIQLECNALYGLCTLRYVHVLVHGTLQDMREPIHYACMSCQAHTALLW